MPGLRRQLLAAHAAERRRLGPTGPLGSAPQAGQIVAGLWSVEQALRDAQLYWIASSMIPVAQAAAATLPEWSAALALPAPCGMLAFATPPGMLPWPGSGEDGDDPLVVPVDGVAWRPTDGGYELSVLVRARRIRAQLAGPWRDSPLMVIATVRLPTGRPIVPRGDDGGRLISLLGASWLLMGQVGIATTEAIDVPPPAIGSGEPPELPTAVTIVELRRLQAPPAEHDPGATGRAYTHRWLVRGHWRQQACGPGHVERRPAWIAPYLKGPDGAPLIEREQVMVWRR